MSLQVPLLSSITIVLQPAIRETVSTLTIDRIVDIPSEKTVSVYIRGRKIDLPQLSGDNYDVPNEWTNADVIAAVKAYYKIS